MHRTRLALASSALLFATLLAGACSDSGSGNGGFAGGAATGANGGNAGQAQGGSGGITGGSSGIGGVGAVGATGNVGGGGVGGGTGGIPDAGWPDVDFKYDASDPDSSACAATVVTGELTPLDMYIMTDKSSSMIGQRWNDVKTAIKAFVNDSTTAGIGVGIQYFPVLPQQYTNTCTSDSQCGSYGPCWLSFCRACAVTHYSTPAVPIAPLPGVAAAIAASIDSITPFGGTPTGPALQGSVDYTSAWAQSHPGHKTVIVLATDGDPYSCTPSDIPSISAIASGALNGPYKILTFVIGVGSSLTNLNAIAAAGGTTKAYLVDTGGNVTQQFIQAMKDIQKKTLGCEYQMPKTDAGIIDPNKVQIEITPSGGGVKTINKVNDSSQCGSSDGFYYDSNTNPTKILLCPTTCNGVQADPGAQVNISLGCLGS